MQVYKTSNCNDKSSFGSIFEPRCLKLNESQKIIVSSIKKAMQEPLKKYKGESAVEYYKNRGFDFEISPLLDDTVTLSAYKDMRKIFTDKGLFSVYSDQIRIGEYNINSEFKISDIDSRYRKNKLKNVFIAVLFSIIGTGMLAAGHNQDKITKIMSDSNVVNIFKNKTKAVFPEATKVLNAFRK